MKTCGVKWYVALLWIVAVGGVARAQSLTVAPAAVSFSYQMGATPLIQQQKAVITLPASLAGQTVKVTNVVVAKYQNASTNTCSLGASNSACGWLSVTPSQGSSPLSVTVTANPSTLTAGSYSASFSISNSGTPAYPQAVVVTLSISNPPSKIGIKSSSFPLDASGNPVQTLSFSCTTDTVALPTAEIDVSSTGDIIPFTVTAANSTAKGSGGGTTPVWLRVALVSGGSGLPSTSASTSAFPGSYAGIIVSLDYVAVQTLDPAGSPYNGTITIAASNSVNGSYTVPVTLNIAAGAPSPTSIFPTSVNAFLPGITPTANYVFTLVGNNFFTTSAVSLRQTDSFGNPVGQIIPLPQPTFLSRQVLQVTVNPAYFAVPPNGTPYPLFWELKLANPASASNPSMQTANFTFYEVDPLQPTISAVVNAASYQPASVWAGTGADPVLVGGIAQPAISPREIISIFGQNLGPATAVTVQPTPMPCPGVSDGSTNCSFYDTTANGISVSFSYVDPQMGLQSVLAPILMISANQVNAIVPKELNNAIGQQIGITLTNGVPTLDSFSALVVQENPGMFTFGGLGQGQGAIINYDSTGTITSVNSTKNAEPRGNTIAIYATGLGELSDPSPGTGDIISTDTNSVFDTTVRVDIGGQPCVVTYAGTAKMTVGGLVQINAVVPPNAKTGTNVPIVVSVGAAGQARSSQSGVTVAVK